MCIWANMLAGVHAVFHAHGLMDAGLISSFEKVVLDSDLIGMVQAIQPGIDFSDADEALEAIREVGPGGHCLGAAHTMSAIRPRFIRPCFRLASPEFWEADGGSDAGERARKMARGSVELHQPPAIDPGIDKALEAYVVRRKSEIGDKEI